jgi:hypothetical protein
MRVAMLAAILTLAAGCVEGAGSGEPAAWAPGSSLPLGELAQMSAEDATNHFMLRMTGGRNVSVLVSERSITGPMIRVTRYEEASDHAMRGEAFGLPVNVDVTAEGASGLYGGGPFDVKVGRVGDTMNVRGMVHGRSSDFSLSPQRLRGNVGECGFEMIRRGSDYVGSRGCRQGVQNASLSFPAAFGRWSMPEMATALAILLSAGS